MHLDLVTDHLGLDPILHGKREDKVEEKEKDARAHPVIEGQDQGGRDHDHADAEDRQEGEDDHEPSPEDGRVESHDGKDRTADGSLNQAADPISLEDGIGDFLKFCQKQPVFVVGQGREFNDETE